jgi:hypothetical protein
MPSAANPGLGVGNPFCQVEEAGPEEEKPWDKYFAQTPPEHARDALEDGWSLIHDGRKIGAALEACVAEMVSDIIWGNLALPVSKTIEKLTECGRIRAIPEAERTEDDRELEAECRRECRAVLELSTRQLEEMHDKKGEFGNEYRVVTAAWYMCMLPNTLFDTPLMAPNDASKAAWKFQEEEHERRRVAGDKWRKQREDETIFDVEQARQHPYELTQTKRRTEITITIPVPAKTLAKDVRAKVTEETIYVTVTDHPLHPILDGHFYRKLHHKGPTEWHLEGEFEARRLVFDLEKDVVGNWPCLLSEDAPPEPPAVRARALTSQHRRSPPHPAGWTYGWRALWGQVPRKVVHGAHGETEDGGVDVYKETANRELPKPEDKFFQWGVAPKGGRGSSGGRRRPLLSRLSVLRRVLPRLTSRGGRDFLAGAKSVQGEMPAAWGSRRQALDDARSKAEPKAAAAAPPAPPPAVAAGAAAAGGAEAAWPSGAAGPDELALLLERCNLGSLSPRLRDEALSVKLLREMAPRLVESLGEIGVSREDALVLKAALEA